MASFLSPVTPFLCWPSFFASPSSTLRDAMQGLAASDRWSADEIAAGRRSQLLLLLEWAAANVPWYRTRGTLAAMLKKARRSPEAFDEEWLGLPLLTKETLRAEGARLNAPKLPQGHAPVAVVRTSGSTGIPVEVNTTTVTRTVWNALAVREHLWQRRDFAAWA